MVEFECRLRRADGDYVWTVVRIGGRSGEPECQLIATVEDISARKAAERDRHVAFERLALVESVIDGAVYEYDPASRLVRWSRGIASVFGYEGVDICPIDWMRSRVHPDDWPAVRTALLTCEAGAEDYAAEYRFRRADGSYADVVDRALVFRDDSGRITRSVGVMSDESRRRTIEDEKRRLFGRITAAAATFNGIIYEYDLEHGMMLHMGGMVGGLHEAAGAHFTSDWWGDRVGAEVAADIRERTQLAIAGGESDGMFEYRFRADDGRTLDIWDNYRIVRDERGRAVRFVGTMHDVTARRQLVDASRDTEMRYKALVEQIPAYIAAADGQGSVLYLSPKSAEIMGLDALDATIPDIWLRMLHREDRDRVLDEMQRAVADDVAFSSQYRLIRQDGTVVWIQAEAVVIRDEEQTPIFVQGVMFDVSEQKRQELELFDANEKLVGWVAELEERDREITLLSEMGELLQACVNEAEAYDVIRPYVAELFSSLAGTVSVNRSNKSLLETVAHWGPEPPDMFFAAEDCWALRRGRVHQVRQAGSRMQCRHIVDGTEGAYICVPLLAKGEPLGVLHVSQYEGSSLTTERERLAITVGEHLALSMANLKLRETLRLQSIRDPLTGLFNRRYMEEALEREVSRADRSGKPLSVLMLDLDHFKNFNDTFGHDAGDALLASVGELLRTNTRASDIVCRYGGEEMVVILPDAPAENARIRAEALRQGIKELEVRHRGTSIGQVTVSIGLSEYPANGTSAADVVRAADIALYESKGAGRDRVTVASERHPRKLSA